MSSEPSLHDQELSEEDKRSALEFALQSDTLNRSDRLKSFLSYICEAEFEGHHERLTEYEIAVSALGRREDFSPLEDSTVRSRAYELRQKLERLYTVEAPHYPVHIELHKGSYRPKFHRVQNEGNSAEASTSPIKTILNEKASWSVKGLAVAGMAGLIVGVVVATTASILVPGHGWGSGPPAMSQASNLGWTPELRELWAPILSGPRSVAIVFETRLFVAVGTAIVVRDPNIENIQDIESSAPIMKVKRLFGVNEVFEARRYADFSTDDAIFYLVRLLSTTGVSMKPERSVDMTNEDVHSCNLVLLGKPGAYDAVKTKKSYEFNFVYQADRSIRNLHPRPGEQEVYSLNRTTPGEGDLVNEYGLITLTPGPERDHYILNLTSGESEGFWPLAEYVTNPVYAKDLVDHLRLPSGKLPESYEVLVKIDERNFKPIQVSYVTHRVIPSSQ